MVIKDTALSINGGARRDRTADLLHAMQALSQLSYSPVMRPSVRDSGAHCMELPELCQTFFLGFLSDCYKFQRFVDSLADLLFI